MNPKSALQLLHSKKGFGSLSLGCVLLDNIIGRIPIQGITEISGEAGSGKTQLCLALSIQAQHSEANGGFSGSVAYLSCGEGEFPIRRLSQIAQSHEINSGISTGCYLENVHIEYCYNIDELLESLDRRIPELSSKKNIKLLIIDSIAGVLRHEFNPSDFREMKTRTSILFRLAQKLKWISEMFKICVVVVNQVTSVIDDSGINKEAFYLPSGDQVSDLSSNGCFSGRGSGSQGSSKPSLGLTWSHCINTRISLTRDTTCISSDSSPNTTALLSHSHRIINPPDDNFLEDPSILSACDSSSRRLKHGDENESDRQRNKENDYNYNAAYATKLLSRRTMRLEFSPCRGSSSCRYEIVNKGVVAIAGLTSLS